ncbi:oocyte zinc finger protein XlCOF8.4-like isoform X1 [Lepisosteus oculatus]|uniref:oocyte zinc finger protein XlCOF8.4-like isoform X1 n=1 Tax=Lepisosteus oculatus TaxID=7918 RepID=UPI0035F51B9C
MADSIAAFQTRLASVMEVLLNAAVSEITDLVEGSFSAFRVEIAHYKKENQALKLRLLFSGCESGADRGDRVSPAGHAARSASRGRVGVRVCEDSALGETGAGRQAQHCRPRDAEEQAPEESADLTELPPDSVPEEMLDLEAVIIKEESTATEEPRPDSLLVKEERPEEDSAHSDLWAAPGRRVVEACAPVAPGERAPIAQPPCEWERGSQPTAPDREEQHRSRRCAEGLGGAESESVAQELRPLGSNLRPDGLHTPEKSTGRSSEMGFISMQGHSTEGRNELDSCDIVEQDTDFQSVYTIENETQTQFVQIKEESSNRNRPASCLCSDYTNPGICMLDSIHIKDETEPQSAHSVAERSELDHNEWKRQRGDSESREEQPVYVIKKNLSQDLEMILRPLSGTVGSPSLQCGGPSSALTPVPVREDSAETSSHTQGHNLCVLCGRTFRTPHSLKGHQRIHTGERPYPCTMCGKTFSYIQNLKVHQRIHTGERPYCCTYCGKTFRQFANHKKHVHIHTGERPYPCAQCAKCFKHLADLKVHQRTHSGERPYGCAQCGKTFTHPHSLKLHWEVHSRERQYSCT